MTTYEPYEPPIVDLGRIAGGPSLVRLRDGAAKPPLFCIHGMGGHVATFMPLATHLAPERIVYGLQGQGLDPGQTPQNRIEDMAERYVNEIREEQPQGPYLLAGWSMGGHIALEMAQRLLFLGERVPLVIMLDTHLVLTNRVLDEIDDGAAMRWIAPRLKIPLRNLERLAPDKQWDYVARRAKETDGIDAATIRRLAETCKAHLIANSCHTPRPYTGHVVLLCVGRRKLDPKWKTVCPELHVETIPGDHYSMLREPDVDVVATRIKDFLAS